MLVAQMQSVNGIVKSIVRGRYAAKDTAAQGRFAKGRSLPGLTSEKPYQIRNTIAEARDFSPDIGLYKYLFTHSKADVFTFMNISPERGITIDDRILTV